MATIPNLNALSVGDGNLTSLNVDTVNKVIQIRNGAKIILYADDGVTPGYTITNTAPAPVVSATAPAIASSGTITTSGIGVSRVAPAGNVTGIIMQAGTVNGQSCQVINESAFTLTMAASGTSGVADGVSDVIAASTARHFIYDTATSLWYRAG